MEVLRCVSEGDTYETTKTKLNKLGLTVKEYPDLDLYLIKYDKEVSDMTDPDSNMCRGMIVRMSDNKAVCVPPPKSCNIEKIYSSIEQWNTLSIEDFIDGTMINLFYSSGKWHISTRSNIGGHCRWYGQKTFNEMFNEACNINFEALDTSKFYTFVLLHPENIIVTKYSIPEIILVSVGTIVDGTYVNLDIYKEDIGIKTPFSYRFDSIQDIKNYVFKQNYQKQGIVIKDKNNNRYKIRNPNYDHVKLMRGNTNNLKYLYYENKKHKMIREYLNYFPEETELYKQFYDEFIKLVKDTLFYYRSYHIKKNIEINKLPYQLKPLCYELHSFYKRDKTPITFDIVYNYINSLDSARIVYILKINHHVELCYNLSKQV